MRIEANNEGWTGNLLRQVGISNGLSCDAIRSMVASSGVLEGCRRRIAQTMRGNRDPATGRRFRHTLPPRREAVKLLKRHAPPTRQGRGLGGEPETGRL